MHFLNQKSILILMKMKRTFSIEFKCKCIAFYILIYRLADVCWFAPIKKEYKKMWNHWYMNDPHAFTKNLNMKSPGYLKSSKWLSEVWSKFECETLRKSFILCGIKKHQLRGASVN